MEFGEKGSTFDGNFNVRSVVVSPHLGLSHGLVKVLFPGG